MDGIADGTLVARPQPADGVSHAPKVTADDARIDWSAPAAAVDRLIRSVTPEPGAWTTFRGERVKLGPLAPSDAPEAPSAESPPLVPGELRVTKRAVLVGTGSAPVVLGQVQAHGKKSMPAADWARGVRIQSSERFADE